MPNSYYEIYIHTIWSTKNREMMIKEEIETSIYLILHEKVRKNKGYVLAKGNTIDHIHMLLSISPDTNIAMLIKEIKGATSYYINQKTEGKLYWQDGYGVLSVSKSGLDIVKQYVEKQKEHHIDNKNLIKIFEKCNIN